MSSWTGPVSLVLLVSGWAWVTLKGFDMEEMRWVRDDPLALGCAGSACIGFVFSAAAIGTKSVGQGADLPAWKRCLAGFFLVTCWSATIDLFLALALISWTKLGAFYYETGELYFKSSWGFAALLYDGTVHWFLQGLAACLILQGKDYTSVALLWAGSIINSMPVLLLGAASGMYSGEIEPSTALNTPYVLVPLAITLHCFLSSKDQSMRKPSELSSIMKVSGLFLAVVNLLMVGVRAVRAMVVLGSRAPIANYWVSNIEPVLLEETGFIRVQVMEDFFFFTTWHFAVFFEFLVRTCFPSLWSTDLDVLTGKWTAFMLGMSLQGQMCWLCMILYNWSSFQMVGTEYVTISSLFLVIIYISVPGIHFLFEKISTSPDSVGRETKKKLKSI